MAPAERVARAAGSLSNGLRGAAGLARFWEFRGELNEGVEALAKISSLLRLQPDFALAHLVYGDVLTALSDPLSAFGSGAPPELVGGLRDEARARLSRYLEAPPPGSVPSPVLEVPRSVGAVIVVELEHFRLYLFENLDGRLVRRGDFYVSIGRGGVAKQLSSRCSSRSRSERRRSS